MQVPRDGLETMGELKMVNSNSMLKLSILLSIYWPKVELLCNTNPMFILNKISCRGLWSLLVNQAKDLDGNMQHALQRTVPVYFKYIIANQYCSEVWSVLGVVILLRLLVLNTFWSLIHDFKDHIDACLIMIVCYISWIIQWVAYHLIFTMINSLCVHG